MEIDNKTLLAGAFILILAGFWFGYLQFPSIQIEQPALQIGGQQPAAPSGEGAAQIQWSMQNAITGADITSADVDAVSVGPEGVVSFMKADFQKAGDSSPEQGSKFYSEGSVVIFHIEDDADPTGGEDYYDNWYIIRIGEGEPLRKLVLSSLSEVTSDPYTYRVNLESNPIVPGSVCHRTSGTTEYWDVGTFVIYPRTDDASLDQYLKYGGTTCASMTDGATEVDTDAEITANATLTSNAATEKLTFQMKCDTASLGYAVPFYGIQSNGKIVERATYLIFSTKMTAIGLDALLNDGWFQVMDSTLTTEKMFAKRVPAQIPLVGHYFDLSIDIPYDSSSAAASTESKVSVWMVDCNILDNVAAGSPTATAPTAYGMMNGYGPQAVINDEIYAVSSGATTTQTLMVYITTAALVT